MGMKNALILLSLFVAAAGVWLGVMENLLRHDGYAGRTLIAACIAVQGIATLLFVLWRGRAIFRGIVMAGAAAFILFGTSAILKILRAQHFEGFVLVIGLALILQGALTLAPLLPRRLANPV
jgi:hypothetical protein